MRDPLQMDHVGEIATHEGRIPGTDLEAAICVAENIEDDTWSTHVDESDDGITVECECHTDLTDYDLIVVLDMRGKDVHDPSAWAEEAIEAVEAYDVEEEVKINLGGRGAPGVVEMVRDFSDVKERVLPSLSKRVARSAAQASGRGWRYPEARPERPLERQEAVMDRSRAVAHGITRVGGRWSLFTVMASVEPGGVPGLDFVGIPEAAAIESRSCIRLGMRAAGVEVPRKHVKIWVTPALKPRHRGSASDLTLAMAMAVAAATGRADRDVLTGRVFCGELGIDGSITSPRGLIGDLGDPAMLLSSYEEMRDAAEGAGLELVGVRGGGPYWLAEALALNTLKQAENPDASVLWGPACLLAARRSMDALAHTPHDLGHAHKIAELALVADYLTKYAEDPERLAEICSEGHARRLTIEPLSQAAASLAEAHVNEDLDALDDGIGEGFTSRAKGFVSPPSVRRAVANEPIVAQRDELLPTTPLRSGPVQEHGDGAR